MQKIIIAYYLQYDTCHQIKVHGYLTVKDTSFIHSHIIKSSKNVFLTTTTIVTPTNFFILFIFNKKYVYNLNTEAPTIEPYEARK